MAANSGDSRMGLGIGGPPEGITRRRHTTLEDTQSSPGTAWHWRRMCPLAIPGRGLHLSLAPETGQGPHRPANMQSRGHDAQCCRTKNKKAASAAFKTHIPRRQCRHWLSFQIIYHCSPSHRCALSSLPNCQAILQSAPPPIPEALPRYMQPSHTLSKPLSSSFFPRTSPIPARLPTGFSPMGSATKSRCFWEVVILNRINLGIPRKSRLGLKTGNSQRLTGNLALKRS